MEKKFNYYRTKPLGFTQVEADEMIESLRKKMIDDGNRRAFIALEHILDGFNENEGHFNRLITTQPEPFFQIEANQFSSTEELEHAFKLENFGKIHDYNRTYELSDLLKDRPSNIRLERNYNFVSVTLKDFALHKSIDKDGDFRPLYSRARALGLYPMPLEVALLLRYKYRPEFFNQSIIIAVEPFVLGNNKTWNLVLSGGTHAPTNFTRVGPKFDDVIPSDYRDSNKSLEVITMGRQLFGSLECIFLVSPYASKLGVMHCETWPKCEKSFCICTNGGI